MFEIEEPEIKEEKGEKSKNNIPEINAPENVKYKKNLHKEKSNTAKNKEKLYIAFPVISEKKPSTFKKLSKKLLKYLASNQYELDKSQLKERIKQIKFKKKPNWSYLSGYYVNCNSFSDALDKLYNTSLRGGLNDKHKLIDFSLRGVYGAIVKKSNSSIDEIRIYCFDDKCSKVEDEEGYEDEDGIFKHCIARSNALKILREQNIEPVYIDSKPQQKSASSFFRENFNKVVNKISKHCLPCNIL